ncbi:hypothetical protein D1872_310510 [compost metagenome]
MPNVGIDVSVCANHIGGYYRNNPDIAYAIKHSARNVRNFNPLTNGCPTLNLAIFP